MYIYYIYIFSNYSYAIGFYVLYSYSYVLYVLYMSYTPCNTTLLYALPDLIKCLCMLSPKHVGVCRKQHTCHASLQVLQAVWRTTTKRRRK